MLRPRNSCGPRGGGSLGIGVSCLLWLLVEGVAGGAHWPSAGYQICSAASIAMPLPVCRLHERAETCNLSLRRQVLRRGILSARNESLAVVEFDRGVAR